MNSPTELCARHRSASSSPSGAFTLIEILVGVAILAILAALLFPVVQRMGAKGRQAETTSRLRTLGTAFAQYAADNATRIPVAYSVRRNSEGLTYGTWGNQLLRGGYLNSEAATPGECETLGCPQQLADHPDANTKYTFGMNQRIGDHPDQSKTPHGARRTVQVTQMTRTALVMNGIWNGTGFNGSADETYASKVEPVFGGDSVMIAFLDGHVAAVKLADIPDNLTSKEGKTFWLGD